MTGVGVLRPLWRLAVDNSGSEEDEERDNRNTRNYPQQGFDVSDIFEGAEGRASLTGKFLCALV